MSCPEDRQKRECTFLTELEIQMRVMQNTKHLNVDSVLKQLKCLKNFAPKDASIINPTVFMYIYCLSLSLPNVVSSVTAVCSPWYSLICAFPCLSLTFGLSWTFCYFSTILKAHFITSPYIMSSGCCFPHSYTCLILDNVLC